MSSNNTPKREASRSLSLVIAAFVGLAAFFLLMGVTALVAGDVLPVWARVAFSAVMAVLITILVAVASLDKSKPIDPDIMQNGVLVKHQYVSDKAVGRILPFLIKEDCRTNEEGFLEIPYIGREKHLVKVAPVVGLAALMFAGMVATMVALPGVPLLLGIYMCVMLLGLGWVTTLTVRYDYLVLTYTRPLLVTAPPAWLVLIRPDKASMDISDIKFTDSGQTLLGELLRYSWLKLDSVSQIDDRFHDLDAVPHGEIFMELVEELRAEYKQRQQDSSQNRTTIIIQSSAPGGHRLISSSHRHKYGNR